MSFIKYSNIFDFIDKFHMNFEPVKFTHSCWVAKGKRVSSFLCHVVVRLLQFGSPLLFVFFPQTMKSVPKQFVLFLGLKIFVVYCYGCGCSYTSMDEGIVHASIQPTCQPSPLPSEVGTEFSAFILHIFTFHIPPSSKESQPFSIQLSVDSYGLMVVYFSIRRGPV